MEPEERFELSTCCLQNSCSDQLSYSGLTYGVYYILKC
jgi:hypothetical protein